MIARTNKRRVKERREKRHICMEREKLTSQCPLRVVVVPGEALAFFEDPKELSFRTGGSCAQRAREEDAAVSLGSEGGQRHERWLGFGGRRRKMGEGRKKEEIISA